MSIALLNFDTSLPSGYSPDSDPTLVAARTLRFIVGADQNSVSAISRVFGDLVQRILSDESKINEIANLLNGNPVLSSFDSTPFVLTNGSHAFTSPQTGVTPTATGHLTTKGYVDGQIGAQGTLIQGNSDDIAALQALVPNIRQSAWTEHVWNGGVKEFQDLTLTVAIADLTKVINIVLLEKLNVGTLMAPSYVYRQVMHGTTQDGFKIDDWWLVNNTTVRLLVPNTTAYPVGYPSGANYTLPSAVQRFFKAVVTETQ